jgi:general secretion pathway protein A
MYHTFYNLQKSPFHVTPDPKFLYLSPSHKEAYASIAYGLSEGKGFIALVGEVGHGKTTIIRSYISNHLNRDIIKPIFIFNPDVSFHELLKVIFQELDVDISAILQAKHAQLEDEVSLLVTRLQEVLIDEHAHGSKVVLIIDEAQNMPVATLDSLRMLTNLESTQAKLLHIVIIGQPELESKLNLPRLRPFRQRIAVKAKLKPLTKKQTFEYINFRLKQAGAADRSIFSRGALRQIYEYSQGTPRQINILCDNALITGYGYGKKKIGRGIIKEIEEDLNDLPPDASSGRWVMVVGACLGILLCLFLFAWTQTNSLDGLTTKAKGWLSQLPFSRLLADGNQSAKPSQGASESSQEAQTAPDQEPSEWLEAPEGSSGASSPEEPRHGLSSSMDAENDRQALSPPSPSAAKERGRKTTAPISPSTRQTGASTVTSLQEAPIRPPPTVSEPPSWPAMAKQRPKETVAPLTPDPDSASDPSSTAQKSSLPGASQTAASQPADQTEAAPQPASPGDTAEAQPGSAASKQSGHERVARQGQQSASSGTKSSEQAEQSGTVRAPISHRTTEETRAQDAGQSTEKPLARSSTAEVEPTEQAEPEAPPSQAEPAPKARLSSLDRPGQQGASPGSKQHFDQRVQSFVSRYTRTYEQKDVEAFMELFTDDAVENGRPVAELKPVYKKNFNRVQSIDYTIDIENLKKHQDYIYLIGRFTLEPHFSNNQTIRSRGKIQMKIRNMSGELRVAQLSYTFD